MRPYLVNNRKQVIWGKIALWLLALLFVSYPNYLSCQKDNIRFIHISKDQGLPQVTINCILQDKKGFMWFGTQEGLTRYDGYDFKSYKHDSDEPTTISDSYVWCVIEDKSGILWIGTNDGGLNTFDPTTEQFNSYRHDANNNNNSLSHNYVRSICEDHEGIMWIGTYGGGLNRFDRKTKIFRKYQLAQSNPINLNNDNVTSIYEDQARNLWVGTHGSGIYRYNRSNDKFEKDLNGLNNNNVNCIFEDRSGALWIGTQGGGLDKLDRTTGRFEHFTSENGLSHNNVLCLFEDQKGIIWIGTEGGGVNTFNRKTRHFSHYAYDVAIPNSLSNDVVRSIWEDNSGVIWIGTHSGGLNKYYPRGSYFTLYQKNASDKNSLSSNDIRAIHEDKSGILWIGTYGGGLNKLDPQTNKYKNYTKENSNLTHNDVRCIFEDHFGTLWIGTRGGGLNKMVDRKNGKFQYYKHDPYNKNSLSNDLIRAIYEDQVGKLWIGTEGGGLNEFDKKTETFNRYTTDNKKLSNDIIFCIYEDRSGILWVGTRVGGLNKYNRDHDSFTCYKHNENEDEKNSLSHNFVLSIYEDRSGVLWIGTYGGGLNKTLDREKGIFKSYRVKDGLSNDVVYGILEDNQGNLWLSTNKGISKFNPKTETFKNYDLDDGLQCDEFNSGAYFKSSTGEMFFGGVNGFNTLYPEDVTFSTFIPPVVIIDLLVDNKFIKPELQAPPSTLKKIIDETKLITLSHLQNSISIKFASLDYSNPQKNQYKYMLEGKDKEWIKSDAKSRIATYTNLPAGEYLFKVKGSNSDGLWNEKVVSLKLKILRPIWKTWWAYILYAIVLAGMVYLIWAAWSTRILKKRVEVRTKELNERNNFLGKINLIVSSINSEMEFGDLLYKILKETRIIKAVEKASALVLDTDTKLFVFKASSGWDIKQLENIKITSEEIVERYIKNSREIYEDIFIAKGVSSRPFTEKIQHLDIPKAMLITCIRCNGKYEAYFIFDNMHDENAFDDEDILLLKNLKEHFVTAFQKARLISQLKNAQVQLIQSEKMRALGDMVANIAHEINNPASFIHTTSYNLRRDMDKFKAFVWGLSGEDVEKEIEDAFEEKFDMLFKHLNTLDEGTNRIKETVNALRVFSRMEKSEVNSVNLHEGLQATLNLVKSKYKEEIDFITDFQPLLEIQGNLAEMNQVFMNIIKNACQSIIEKQKKINDNKKGTVTIKTFTQNDEIMIIFQDTGTGIPQKIREKMFEPFFTTRATGEGTGLGLSVSFGIIKKHQGRIDVESEEGKGTTITLHLPIYQTHQNS